VSAALYRSNTAAAQPFPAGRCVWFGVITCRIIEFTTMSPPHAEQQPMSQPPAVRDPGPTVGRSITLRTQQMLEGAILPQLLRMAAPNALGFLVQAGVSMVEAWYIGQLGTVSLAAIALVFPGLMLMQMLSGGAFGGAVTSAIARSLGSGDSARAEALIWHALSIGVAAAAVFGGVAFIWGESILEGLGARGDVLDQARSYAGILFGGSVFIWLMSLLGAVFRGMGDMKTPAFLMIAGAAVQIPLSGALILGWFGAPQLGIAGGAVSVLVVAALNCVILLARLVYGQPAVPLKRAAMRFRRALFADIARVGALAALSPVFVVLTIGVLNGVMGKFGTAAIAGYGIGARLEFLLIPLVFGLGASMTSLVGVNIGAGNVARAERIGWNGGIVAAALTGSVGALLAIAPGLWMNLFTDDPATYAAGATYLRIVGPAFLFQGLGLSLYFASQGAGTVVWPVLATILRFVVAACAAVVGVRWFDMGLVFVCLCIAAGMILYGVLTAASLYFGAWRVRGR